MVFFEKLVLEFKKELGGGEGTDASEKRKTELSDQEFVTLIVPLHSHFEPFCVVKAQVRVRPLTESHKQI